MSRIQATFESLSQRGRKALISYITAGDPSPEVTVPLMHKMVAAGTDMIELGVPFSDPMADGPVIQAASERALRHHVSLTQVLAMVQTFRQSDTNTPVILMGYLNPIEVMGYEQFADSAAGAGVDGALIVDLPPQEAQDWLPLCYQKQLDPLFLIAPTSTEARIKDICTAARGFVYYVSLKGVTGASHLDLDGVRKKVNQIREFTKLPIGVGFGIKDADSARQVGEVADAVIVGSAIVKLVEANADHVEQIHDQVACLVQNIRQALDQINMGDC